MKTNVVDLQAWKALRDVDARCQVIDPSTVLVRVRGHTVDDGEDSYVVSDVPKEDLQVALGLQFGSMWRRWTGWELSEPGYATAKWSCPPRRLTHQALRSTGSLMAQFLKRVMAVSPESFAVLHPLVSVSWRRMQGKSPDVRPDIGRSGRNTLVAWERRSKSWAETEKVVEVMRGRVEAIERPEGALIAFQGICRVIVGSDDVGLRGNGERLTALVVHVIADGEPARSVVLPLE